MFLELTALVFNFKGGDPIKKKRRVNMDLVECYEPCDDEPDSESNTRIVLTGERKPVYYVLETAGYIDNLVRNEKQ